MVLIKRKPIIYTPLPSLSTVLQPLSLTENQPSPAPGASGSVDGEQAGPPIPADADNDDEQMERLQKVFRGEFEGAQGNVGPGKGKKAGTKLLNPLPTAPTTTNAVNGALEAVAQHANGNGTAGTLAEGLQNGEHHANGAVEEKPVHWRIWDRECFYLPETGEIFTDYESFVARVTFYQQPLYSCESTAKSNISFYKAYQSELRETRALHTKFPKQLKVPVLKAVQFQIEGKMESLVEMIFERFHNRFFDDERVFVDVEGDKYLARIVKTFPPRSRASTSQDPVTPHALASDLNMTSEELNERDDPMKYFYNVRLIEKGSEEDLPPDYASNGRSTTGDEGESWGGSVMEVQADKISRERTQFSRIMLKRFFKDCLTRETAVYSPWLLKPQVAERYGLPMEMSEQVKQRIAEYKERKMESRKREREERLGLNQPPPEVEATEEEKPKPKKIKKEEEKPEEEEPPKVKKPTIKYPCDDLLLEYSETVDQPAGRLKVRPPLDRSLPFGEQFEKFLMSWSFLNAMGKPLKLSSFNIDDYEQALYHQDPWTSPTPLMVEIHATLLNALIRDIVAGQPPVGPITLTGRTAENDTDYWEGKKGATAETLRPIVEPLAANWNQKFLKAADQRKGWESALVGCLWERATLDTLPNYLDNILHMTFEDKPAPTRPTWSTGPANVTAANGLIPSKPEKRWFTLHHTSKLDIIAFLIELVAQTASVRDYMEEETAALTENRKEQIEVKRECRRIEAEIVALIPKEEGETAAADPDVPKSERGTSIDPSVNGRLENGTNTERDELESSPALMDEYLSELDPEDGPNATAASRRRAMKEKAQEREAEEALRVAKAAEDRARSKETKQQAAERKRLNDELAQLSTRLRHIDYELRAHFGALRARSLASDRFGNKVWWIDGAGSSPLMNDKGQITFGTGRVYVQGADEQELEVMRLALEDKAPTKEEVEKRREEEEGGRLRPGEWGAYDTIEQLQAFMKWLNPRGQRDLHLLKALRNWQTEIEAGIHKRRVTTGLEETNEGDEPVKKSRPVRKVVAAGGMDRNDEEGGGFQMWKNRRAKDK